MPIKLQGSKKQHRTPRVAAQAPVAPESQAAAPAAPVHPAPATVTPPMAEAALIEVLDGERISAIAKELNTTPQALRRGFKHISDERRQEIIRILDSQKVRIRFKAHDTLEQMFDDFDLDHFRSLPSDLQAATIRDIAMALSRVESLPKVDMDEMNRAAAPGTVLVIKPASMGEWEEAVRGDLKKFDSLRQTAQKPIDKMLPAGSSSAVGQ